MEATGVSFAEQQMRRGKYYDQPRFPFVPGYDLIGTVEQVGNGAAAPGVGVGTRVAALTKVGAWADRVLLDARDLVPVPQGVDPADAETVVVNGITAWRMLHRTARVRAEETIVVLGAAGGVGTMLVQLGRHSGIRVIGTAGPARQERLRELGAVPLDYRRDDVPTRVRDLALAGEQRPCCAPGPTVMVSRLVRRRRTAPTVAARSGTSQRPPTASNTMT